VKSAVGKLLGKTRRLWILERSASGLLLAAGWAAAAWLVSLLVGRPGTGAIVAAGLAAVALAAIVLASRAKAPTGSLLAQALDERAGTADLFASALEFAREPERFGWLGALACEKARAEAAAVRLRHRWSFGPARRWVSVGTVAALLALANAAALATRAASHKPQAARPNPEPVTRNLEAGARNPAPETPKDLATPAKEPADAPEPEKPSEETVQITNEMIDKYLQQVPDQQEIDLEGVTPIRWDADEVSGKANPQDQRREGEKIDPVKLDAALLKDLQDAKKTKDEGKPEGGVDIAVVGKPSQGAKAKGKEGGKDDTGSLANAVSKDPRGNPSRLAVKPARTGLPVRSAARSPVREPGQERPMGLLDFLAAMRRGAAAPADGPEAPLPQPGGRVPDRAVPQEPVPDAAAEVVESYFGRLRKADR